MAKIKTVVYHICRECDKYDFSKGYIGISCEFDRRMKVHKRYGNLHVKNAYSKYDDIIEYVVLISNREHCLRTEANLRPHKNMGWNIECGGGNPPKAKKGQGLGHRHSEETKKKMSETRKGKSTAKKGQPAWNKGIPNPRKGMPLRIVTCPHCGKEGAGGSMKRYHFDNCKEKNND